MKSLIRFILFIIFVTYFLLPKTVNAEETKLLFYLPFEESFENVVTSEDGDAKDVRFVEGKVGQGAYFDVGSFLRFASKGNINLRQGTVELWVKPNWNGDDGGYHYFFAGNISDARNFNSIHLSKKQYQGGVILGQIDGTENESSVPDDNLSQSSVAHWKKGEWHHLALTWNYEKRTLKLYIDGILYATHDRVPYASFPTGYETYINIGSSIDEVIFAEAVIDELKIWDYPRSDLQIAESVGLSTVASKDFVQGTSKEKVSGIILSFLEKVGHFVQGIKKSVLTFGR